MELFVIVLLVVFCAAVGVTALLAVAGIILLVFGLSRIPGDLNDEIRETEIEHGDSARREDFRSTNRR